MFKNSLVLPVATLVAALLTAGSAGAQVLPGGTYGPIPNFFGTDIQWHLELPGGGTTTPVNVPANGNITIQVPNDVSLIGHTITVMVTMPSGATFGFQFTVVAPPPGIAIDGPTETRLDAVAPRS